MIVRDTLVFRTLLAIARQRVGYDETRSRALLELLATADILHAQLRQRLRELALSEAQFATLVVLRALDPDPVLPTTLASQTNASRATMTAVLDHLVAHTLALRARSDDDRRNYLITLTDAGRSLVDHAVTVVLQACTALARPLSDPAPHALLALCEKLTPHTARTISADTAPIFP
jgi:DNA-binding MarR family transcriptional regulator